MTKLLRLSLTLLLGLVVGAGLAGQKPADLTGTWTGPATLDVEPEPNELTLVLSLVEGKITGHITDEYGVLNQVPLENVVLEGAAFSFSVAAAGPSGDLLTLKFAMTIEGDAMKGKLEIPDMGAAGTWTAKKTE